MSRRSTVMLGSSGRGTREETPKPEPPVPPGHVPKLRRSNLEQLEQVGGRAEGIRDGDTAVKGERGGDPALQGDNEGWALRHGLGVELRQHGKSRLVGSSREAKLDLIRSGSSQPRHGLHIGAEIWQNQGPIWRKWTE
jgi:hypothetical protein